MRDWIQHRSKGKIPTIRDAKSTNSDRGIQSIPHGSTSVYVPITAKHTTCVVHFPMAIQKALNPNKHEQKKQKKRNKKKKRENTEKNRE